MSALRRRARSSVLHRTRTPRNRARGDVFPEHIARRIDGFGDYRECFRVRLEIRCKTALITHPGRESARVQDLTQRVEDLHTATQRLVELIGTDRLDHELLNIDVVIGVLAAVQDVHHRHRHAVAGPSTSTP